MEEKVKRDVVYIDIDDDITDIISKVRSSKERIVAVVPPKEIGTLRSSVNLRLLARASKKDGKRIVIVSNNDSLKTMAAAAEIPVAKTLQSKPEIPEISAIKVDEEDVIDGSNIEVPDFGGEEKLDQDKGEKEIAAALETVDIDDNKQFSKKEPEVAKKSKKKAAPVLKVPNFNAFRKKIFLFGGLALAVIVFFVWAIFFAPAAKVTISAKTSDVNISKRVSLSASASKADAAKNIIPAKTEVIEKTEEVSIDVTGSKEVGEAASGIIEFSQSTESEGYTIKNGTTFSYGACNFMTTQETYVSGFDVTLSGGQVSRSGDGYGSVSVKATKIGEDCNLASGTSLISPIEGLSAVSGGISGGSKKTIKVVSQNDVDSARQKLALTSDEVVKKELFAKFGDDYQIIDASYSAETVNFESSPSVDAEASNGKLTAKMKFKYSLTAISKKDIEEYLTASVKSGIDESNQQIFENGSKNVKIDGYAAGDFAINAVTTAKVGPKIDEAELKEQLKGKVFGEARALVEKIKGVRDVKVDYSYFWVNKIPNDENKITVDFTVENEG